MLHQLKNGQWVNLLSVESIKTSAEGYHVAILAWHGDSGSIVQVAMCGGSLVSVRCESDVQAKAYRDELAAEVNRATGAKMVQPQPQTSSYMSFRPPDGGPLPHRMTFAAPETAFPATPRFMTIEEFTGVPYITNSESIKGTICPPLAPPPGLLPMGIYPLPTETNSIADSARPEPLGGFDAPPGFPFKKKPELPKELMPDPDRPVKFREFL